MLDYALMQNKHPANPDELLPPAESAKLIGVSPDTLKRWEKKIPDVINQNAEIAREQLEQIGLTNIQLVSANPKYQLVLRAANWTVVDVDPPLRRRPMMPGRGAH